MKLCDVTQFYSPTSGGVRRYIMERQKFIARGGEHQHVLIIPGHRTECFRDGVCTIYTIQSPRVDRNSRYRVLLNLPELRRIIARERPDLVESGDPYHVAWAVVQEAAKWRIACTGFYHSHFPDAYLRTLHKYSGRIVHDFVQDYARRYIEKLYNCFDATLVPSPHLRAILADWGVRNAVAVKLGVDPEIFHPGPREGNFRKEHEIPEKPLLLLSVGRLAGEKNTLTLLRAFERLHKEHPGRFHLLVVGEGPLRPEVAACATRTGAVTWHKYFSDSRQLARAYRASDLFVHPGVCETFGLVTVEAQACGLPVVGIRGSFMDRLVLAGLEDWADENTPDSLAKAIERMSQRSLQEMGHKASQSALFQYAWPKVFGELFEIYQGLVMRG